MQSKTPQKSRRSKSASATESLMEKANASTGDPSGDTPNETSPDFMRGFELRVDRLAGEMRRAINDVRTAAQVLALGSDRIAHIPAQDHMFRFHLPQADRDITQKRIMLNGILPNADGYAALALRLPRGGVFVDVGGYLGVSASFFSRICCADEVHIFEPQKVVMDVLLKNIELNEVKNATVHQNAIMDEETTVNPGVFRGADMGATPFLKHAGGRYNGISLDSLNFEAVDVLNLDYNGPKMLALTGAEGLIEKCKPFVVVDKTGRDIKDVITFLTTRGYRHDQTVGLLIFYPEAN